MWEEIQARQAILKGETRLRKGQRFTPEKEKEEDNLGNMYSVDRTAVYHCNHKSTCFIEFLNNEYRKIHRGCCIGKSLQTNHNHCSKDNYFVCYFPLR